MTESQPNGPPVESPEAAAAARNSPPPPAAEAPVAAAVATAAPTLEERLAQARKEAADNYDRYLRAVADLENYRRRMARERDELRTLAAIKLMQHLLPVLDNLQLAVAAARQESAAKTITDGVAIVLEQLRGVLASHGLMELNPLGQEFDPHLHESIAHQPSAEVPEEHVLQVVRIGYSLHGRLLRPASVIVSGGAAKEAKA